MTRFLLGFLVVHAAVFMLAAVDLVLRFAPLGGAPADAVAALAVTVLVLPLAAAWIAGEAVALRRPRRLFDRRLHHGWRRVAAGGLTGLIALVLFAALLVLVDAYVPPAVVAIGASFGVTLLAMLLMRPVRAGRCIHCHYDGRGAVGVSRCPECGHEPMAAVIGVWT